MEMRQVSENRFAVLIEKNRVCDANSGLINLAGGVVKSGDALLVSPLLGQTAFLWFQDASDKTVQTLQGSREHHC